MKTVWNPAWKAASAIVGVGFAVGLLVPSAPVGAQEQPEVTFTRDIAPILQRTCQNCHRPEGGLAPMALTTYEEVRPWAKAIKRRTSAREMPPWFIEKDVGIQKYKDDISLSDDEIAKIASWVDGGTVQGNPADLPPPLQFTKSNTWAIGTPDLIVRSPVQTVPAIGGDIHKPYLGSTPTDLNEDRWISAWEVREFRPREEKRSAGRPGQGNNYLVLHHQGIGTSPNVEAADGDAVFPRSGFRYTYEVGQNAQYYTADTGAKLPAGGSIYFNQTHQHPIGKEVKFQVEIGFKLYPEGHTPKYEVGGYGNGDGRTPSTMGLGDELDIPGNTDNIRDERFFVLNKPARMVTFEPHLHASGKRMCVEAIYPDGTNETLTCAGYNHSWVRAYVYDDDAAPLLPKGTIMHFIGWYDNSANNPRVVDPRNWRGLGHRSIDDMFIDISRYQYYTDEQFKEEVAAREAKKRLMLTTAQNAK